MVFIYDGSYEGLLSCVFTIFKSRVEPVDIASEAQYQASLLDAPIQVTTNEDWALRVIKGIDVRTQGRASELIYSLYLSELPGSEMLVYHLIQAIIRRGDASVLENFADANILRAAQIEKMIHREVHRMHAFVRFQKRRDGLFCAAIEPDFNVIPLIGDHFERRYADQCWLIFDTRRHYGLYYDKTALGFIAADDPVINNPANLISSSSPLNASLEASLTDEKELEYQALWKNYFHAVNIKERNNAKLHLRHMPRRYWKCLTEKTYR